MRAAAACSLLCLASLVSLPLPARAQQVRTPEELEAEQEAEALEVAPPANTRYTEGNIDYDVTYDDSVAQSYDDGYDPGADAQFDESLAPYGTWIDDDTYGRVWQPSVAEVGADFSPYATGGRWAMTEYGWTWISDWDWGWAPFHYGRWTTLADRGWCWLPGTLWGPAWVSWRAGNGYVGWAPMPPRHVSIGSPLGARSAWRFALAADLGRGRPPMLPARIVPGIFGRMTVVSNPRALPIPGSRVRVNAGPTFVGTPPAGGVAPANQVRLAVLAPHALPRRAIEPHPGTPAIARPWVRTGGVSGDRAFTQRAATPDQRAPFSPGAGPQRGPMPVRGGRLFPGTSPSSSSSTPPGAMPMNRRPPAIRAPAMTSARPAPAYQGPVSRSLAPAPMNRTAAPGYRTAAPMAAARPWAGARPQPMSAPRFSGSSFGSTAGRSFGGTRSFGGGGGGGRAFGGGRSFGGGRR